MMIRHLELFAGIGGFRQALELLAYDFGLGQSTVGFSEIDRFAVQSYRSVYDTKDEMEIGDIVSFCADESNIRGLPDFDLLTAGFPCQPFSMMGEQKGFADERGTLFFQVASILRIKRPRYVLLENVRNLKNHDNKKTLERIVCELKACGYPTVLYDVFDTEDFGLAQKRNRIFIFASTDRYPDLIFTHSEVRKVFENIAYKSVCIQKNIHEILEKHADEKYFLSDRFKPTILADGSKNFHSHSDINQMIARPLTATMTKMHRACQDNYFSEGFILSEEPEKYLEMEFSKEELASQRIRKITPSEALALQGWSKGYLDRILHSGNSDYQLYRQAGNSISVNVAYAIMHYLFIHKGV